MKAIQAVAMALVAGVAWAAPDLRLPLPVDPPAQAVAFEVPTPTGAVLTGLLLPSNGPLIAWAPVFSTLGADGNLTEVQPGGWVGPRPDRWLKVVRKGNVIAGFRVLVRTTAPLQTRQLQVFWRPWSEGARGAVSVSMVYGSPAATSDTVRIVELTVPEGSVATGLYGQTVGGAVAQVSLLVRSLETPAAAVAADASVAPALSPVGPVAPTVTPPTLK